MEDPKKHPNYNEACLRSYVKTDDFIFLIQESSLTPRFKERLLRHLREKKIFEKPNIPSLLLGACFTSFGTKCITDEDQKEFLKAVNITSDTKRLPQFFRGWNDAT